MNSNHWSIVRSATMVGALAVAVTACVGQPSGLQSIQESFRTVAEKVLPVVVEIDVVEVVAQEGPSNPFERFFAPPQNEGDTPRQFRNQGLGSGVIVRRNGRRVYVLTNNHVVGEAEEIAVKLNDGRSYEASLVGGDERKDLALVVFETSDDVPVAELGDSDALHVGDWALAIGNPFGLDSTVTAGIVSALHRRGGPNPSVSQFIQTDAAISPGNSGGALVNIDGEVIGINTWIASNTGANQGYGFAIPINSAKRTIDDFIDTGKAQYAWLGVQIQTPNEQIALDLGVGEQRGALVSQVFKGSPAEKGGIFPGDLVISLNDEKTSDHMDLTEKLGDHPPGQPARIVLIRQGREVKLTIQLTVRAEEKAIAAQNENLWPGMAVFPLTEELRKELGVSTTTGVIIYDVIEETPAQVAGFRAEDVVLKMGGRSIESLQDFYGALAQEPELSVTVERKSGTETILLDR